MVTSSILESTMLFIESRLCSTQLYTHTNTNNINKTWPFLHHCNGQILYYIIDSHCLFQLFCKSRRTWKIMNTFRVVFFIYWQVPFWVITLFDFDRNNIYNSNNSSPLAWECFINWNNYLLILCKYVVLNLTPYT